MLTFCYYNEEGRKKMYVLAENWHGLWRRKLIDLYESWNCLNPCLYRYFCFQNYTLARRGGMCLLVSYSGDRRIVWAQGLGGQLWHLFLRETKACMQKPSLTAEGPQSPRSAGSASPYRRWTLQTHSEGGMRVWVSKGLWGSPHMRSTPARVFTRALALLSEMIGKRDK